MNADDHSWTIRQPVHAGQFYPDDPATLRAEVGHYLAEARSPTGPCPKALIAPHAGYMFSGPVAGSAYARLRPARTSIRRVVLIGPAHYARFPGLAASSVDAFASPLGPVRLDRDAIERLTSLPQVRILDSAHRREHCLEVHLPFLQTVLESFTLVPLLVGDAGEAEVGEVLEHAWGGPETCIIVSSDLSHRLDYATARELDRATARAIEELRSGDLDGECACGWEPIRGLLHVARRRHLSCHTIDLRNSGDTSGLRYEVVGYGAFVLDEPIAECAA